MEDHRHRWGLTLTPSDSARKWYRCSDPSCFVFGYKKNGRFIPYRCSEKGCRKDATDREPGRGPRATYLWRCDDHRQRPARSRNPDHVA